jgi:hypothetical protein
MVKVVRLTESDLVRLVKKVLNEQPENNYNDISDLPENKKNLTKLMVLLDGANARSIDKVLPKLSQDTRFISFINCEYADFSKVDLCEFPDLVTVFLRNTPNNLEETQGDCFEKLMDSLYDFDTYQDKN